MNNLEENAIKAFNAIRKLCDDNKGVWENYAPFVASYAIYLTNMGEIDVNREIQLRKITGVASDKNLKKSTLSEKALFIANRIRSFATVEKDSVLLETISYTPSDFAHSRDDNMISICNIILQKATENSTKLVAYGITQEVMDDFTGLTHNFSEVVALPRIAKAKHKTATQNLRRLIRETKVLLKTRLDLDAEYFKTTQPDFYSDYQGARMIIELGRHKKGQTQISGKVSDFETEQPLAGVKVYLNDVAATYTLTDAAGSYLLEIAALGTYTIKAEMTGYDTYSEEFEIENHESLELDIEMEKGE